MKIVFALLGVTAGCSLTAATVDFARDVQPILVERCHECHGAQKQKNGYRLDRKAEALHGGDSGKPAIVPGRSSASPLFQRITSHDKDELMPPKGQPLTTNQIALLKAWIDAGAPWPEPSPDSHPTAFNAQRHWAFQPPQRPSFPKVKNHRWPRNAIDTFILAQLEHEGFTPSPEADRNTLLRRLCLDLLGLPPTPEQVSAFREDRRPDAYERLVEDLLASPHFGERWGRHWLDLARYADSEGYQIDRARPHAYVYRDWVIDAINTDLPFDQFTVEQLAGDLLPNASVGQKTAVGFHRNTLMNYEDGTDAEEFRCKAKVDRVSTTGTVWLGLTVGCAECHSHKYDPISQREFYQLYAFFNNADEVEVPAPQLRDPNARAQSFAGRTNAPAARVHIRGDFLRPGDEVRPGGIAALHPFAPRGAQADRLDLARWLVDPANPLTARGAVNHLWQHLFGRGLVNTAEDFGVRGEPPSHPELLDWLATEFRLRGWSRKALLKLIVTSATYRQSSGVREELRERDPLNVWLARQNRFRLEAEIVRDTHLAAGGRLNPELGGPSFRPRTTDEFKALGGAGAFTWADDTGPALRRRGLYIFAARTVPYPTSVTFDQANPSECCARRERSNTPLQALTLLNHSVFFESAQGLARRMSAFLAETPRAKIEHGFGICFGRPPARAELDRLERLYEQEQPTGRKPGGGPSAAFIAVAQVMLNLEEFATRE